MVSCMRSWSKLMGLSFMRKPFGSPDGGYLPLLSCTASADEETSSPRIKIRIRVMNISDVLGKTITLIKNRQLPTMTQNQVLYGTKQGWGRTDKRQVHLRRCDP